MATVTVQEGDGHTIRVEWRDGAGVAFTPSTVRYRVDCKTTGTERLSWQSVTPTSTTTIDIPGTAHNIVNAANASETKQVTVQANAGMSNQRSVKGEYEVPNNRFVS